MGSYLSVVNNTPHEYKCRVSADEAALKIAGSISTVLASAAAILGTVGLAAPLSASLAAGGVISIMGISTSALAAIAGVAGTAGDILDATTSVSDFTLAIASGVNDVLTNKGYVTIPAGGRHQWGPMSLSLWQQASCTRTYIVNPYAVRVETINMRPIFSASLAGNNRDHDIQYWLNKNGPENQDIVAPIPAPASSLALTPAPAPAPGNNTAAPAS